MALDLRRGRRYDVGLPTLVDIDLISKLKLALIILCLVAIPASYAQSQRELGSVTQRVERIEPACLRYGSDSPECRRSFTAALRSITPAQVCGVLELVGLDAPRCDAIKRAARSSR